MKKVEKEFMVLNDLRPSVTQLKGCEIMQLPTAQMEKRGAAIVQPAAAQLGDMFYL